MGIDKFGRSQLTVGGVKAKLLKGPKGDGFQLKEDGNFDLQNKKLCNVADPSDDGDVVTLKFLDERLNKLKLQLKEKIDFLKDISKLLDVFEVSKNYVSLKSKRRIVSVNQSINTNDVVVRKELETVLSKIQSEIKSVRDVVASIHNQFNSFTEQTNAAIKILTETLKVVTTALSSQTTSVVITPPPPPS
jgi:AAA15 family ATPase/GTPase